MGEVREEFNKDDHYVGLASNRSPPSFRVTTECHEGYMLILLINSYVAMNMHLL